MCKSNIITNVNNDKTAPCRTFYTIRTPTLTLVVFLAKGIAQGRRFIRKQQSQAGWVKWLARASINCTKGKNYDARLCAVCCSGRAESVDRRVSRPSGTFHQPSVLSLRTPSKPTAYCRGCPTDDAEPLSRLWITQASRSWGKVLKYKS